LQQTFPCWIEHWNRKFMKCEKELTMEDIYVFWSRFKWRNMLC